MLRIAVTGGVACGKTVVATLLLGSFPPGAVTLFSCDTAVGELIDIAEVRDAIDSIGCAYGASLRKSDRIDKKALRELLFENSEFRGRIEGVLHPMVLDRVIAHSKTLSSKVRVSMIEVPLLYEVNFPVVRDIDLVVAASESTQMRRLCQDRGHNPPIAKQIIESQLPMEEKIQKANIVVWNDGDLESLQSQTDHLVSRCEKLFN